MAADFEYPVPPAAPRLTVQRWLIHGGAFLATLVTTTYFGGWHYVGFVADLGQPLPGVTPSGAAFWATKPTNWHTRISGPGVVSARPSPVTIVSVPIQP